MAGFDASAATVKGIKDGFISLVIDQQQYLQGFEAVQQLCLSKKYGFSGLFINTGGGFIDKSNVDAIAPLVTAADPLRQHQSGPTGDQAGWRARGRPPADSTRGRSASSSGTSRSRSAACKSSRTSTSSSIGAKSLGCSATTALASRRSSRSSPAFTSPMTARCASPANRRRPDRSEGARARGRDGVPGASAGRPATAVAQHLHGPPAEQPARLPGSGRDASRSPETSWASPWASPRPHSPRTRR